MLCQQHLNSGEIIERGDQHLVTDRLRNAGAIGHSLRKINLSGWRETHLGFSAHAVIPALKFQNLCLSCKGSGQPDGIHIRLATRGDKPNLLTTRNRITNRIGKLYSAGIIGKKGHAFGQLL